MNTLTLFTYMPHIRLGIKCERLEEHTAQKMCVRTNALRIIDDDVETQSRTRGSDGRNTENFSPRSHSLWLLC